MNQYLIAIIGFLSYGTLLGALEVLSRRFSLPAEYIRRISHISAAIFVAFFSLYLSAPFLLTILSIFILVMLLSRLLKIFNHIHSVARPTIGEELLPLGFIVAYLILNGETTKFIPVVLVVGLADPITGIVVQKYKNNVFGILTFMIVTIAILLVSSRISPLSIILVSLFVAITERLSPYGSDNLSIPVLTALLLRYL